MAPCAVEQQGRAGGDKADSGKNPLAGEQHHHHGREHGKGDQFIAHERDVPRAWWLCA